MYPKILLAVFSFSILILGCGSKDNSQNTAKPNGQPGPTTVQGEIIATQDIANQITLNGNLLPNEEVQLQPEISGRVTQIYFNEGQFVPAGKLLVKLNDADLQAQKKKAEVALELAQQDESRKKQLLAIKAIAVEEYDQAATLLKSAKADIELLQAQIDKTEIKAPFSGIIGLRQISAGTFVNAGQVIAELQQINPMKLDFAVPEKYVAVLKVNSKVNFTVEGIRNEFSANIYAIDPSIDLSSRSFRVRATTLNPNNVLKRGAFANIALTLEQLQDAVMVPASAIIPEIRGQKVLLIKEGKVTSQLVEVGMRTDRQVHVIEGLTPGDTLITAGLLQLREGTPVVLKQP
jgi:membrane fusion protein (multidrug efflux system)